MGVVLGPAENLACVSGMAVHNWLTDLERQHKCQTCGTMWSMVATELAGNPRRTSVHTNHCSGKSTCVGYDVTNDGCHKAFVQPQWAT